MRILLLTAFLVFLSGCATTQPCEPVYKIKEVPKIVYKMPPAPQEIHKPSLPVDDLKIGDDADAVAKAYVASLELLKSYTKMLEIALEPYKNVEQD